MLRVNFISFGHIHYCKTKKRLVNIDLSLMSQEIDIIIYYPLGLVQGVLEAGRIDEPYALEDAGEVVTLRAVTSVLLA